MHSRNPPNNTLNHRELRDCTSHAPSKAPGIVAAAKAIPMVWSTRPCTMEARLPESAFRKTTAREVPTACCGVK